MLSEDDVEMRKVRNKEKVRQTLVNSMKGSIGSMFAEVDDDGSGSVSMEELCTFLKRKGLGKLIGDKKLFFQAMDSKF